VPSKQTPPNARKRLERDVLAKKPDLVIVAIWDQRRGGPTSGRGPTREGVSALAREDYERNLRDPRGEDSVAAGPKVILMDAQPPRAGPPPACESFTASPPTKPDDPDGFITSLLHGYAGGRPQGGPGPKRRPLVDVYSLFEAHGKQPGHSGRRNCSWTACHPNDSGHKIVAERLIEEITRQKNPAEMRFPFAMRSKAIGRVMLVLIGRASSDVAGACLWRGKYPCESGASHDASK